MTHTQDGLTATIEEDDVHISAEGGHCITLTLSELMDLANSVAEYLYARVEV